ncbi:hypothetical protein ARMGADRAFT_1019360 [Armillaria gallica]|uniref:Uncharacterized protein n=1 Tax=Armillaria gallica TaxID=47427 RepID=A0A2H3CMD4_ARMGA|nr:hypothetical protein ARMGADRAFT_1019360 [Armillaria gallica]
MLFIVVIWGVFESGLWEHLSQKCVDNLYGMGDGRSSFFVDRCTCRLLTRTTENIKGPKVMRDDEEM